MIISMNRDQAIAFLDHLIGRQRRKLRLLGTTVETFTTCVGRCSHEHCSMYWRRIVPGQPDRAGWKRVY